MKRQFLILLTFASLLFSAQEQVIMTGKCPNENLTQKQKAKIKDSLTSLVNTEKNKTISMYKRHLENGFIKQEEYDRRVKLREDIAVNKSGAIQNTPMNCTTDFSGPEEKEVYWYHYDHLGSVTHITGMDGEVVQNMEYFPSGETFVQNHLNSPNSPYKYNAKELDDETGYYYYGARYLNPRTSLWLNVDPLAGYDPIMNTEHYIDGQHNAGVYKSGNLNPYIYAYNSPVIYVDPNGKQTYFNSKIDGYGNRFFEYVSENPNPKSAHERAMTYVNVYDFSDKKVVDIISGYDAAGKTTAKYGKHYNKEVDHISGLEATKQVAKIAWESDEVRPILLAPFEAVAFAQLDKYISLGKYLDKIGSGSRYAKQWNLGQAVVEKGHHNWSEIFGRKPNLKEIMPYVEQAVREGEWRVTGVIHGRKGVSIGEKLELLQNVKGHNIWVGGTREASTGKIIINNAAVAK